MKNKKEEEGLFSNYFYMLGFIMKNSPALLVGSLLCEAAMQMPWMLSSVILLKYIIDIFQSGENFGLIFALCIGFAVIVLVTNAANTVFYERFRAPQLEKLKAKLYSTIYEKAARMDISSYDDPKFYNDFVLSMNTMGDKIENTMQITINLFVNLFIIVTIAGIIAAIDPVCLIFIAACVGMMIPLGKLAAKVSIKRTEAMTPIDRRNKYYWRVFYLGDYAKEIRLNPFGELTHKKYNKTIIDRLDTISPFLKKQWKLYFCNESLPVTLAVYFAVTLYMGYKIIVVKDTGLGDFAATFNGAGSISSAAFFIASWFALQFRENALYIGKFRKFMNAEEKIVNGENTTVFTSPKVIKFNNVGFTYPGNTEPTLRNINLEIRPNEKIALVGYNGAGKTTLTNLLLRLYDVTEGSITVDGVDIREWDIASYHKNFAAVFQDFSIFGATVGENVAMSDSFDNDRVLAAVRESGFDKKLDKGADTVLLREFDENGMSLSGGEAQKLAVSRAYYKDCPFAVLDEPSANLDPLSEYELNHSIIEAAKDKTVVFISHRLSTTRIADRIYMMENGEIVESGSHEELMALGGKYAYMFELQAEKYVATIN